MIKNQLFDRAITLIQNNNEEKSIEIWLAP